MGESCDEGQSGMPAPCPLRVGSGLVDYRPEADFRQTAFPTGHFGREGLDYKFACYSEPGGRRWPSSGARSYWPRPGGRHRPQAGWS